jgi:hypothetical protein
VLVLTPDRPLATADFARIAGIVDPYPYIEQLGKLKALLIHTSVFPGLGRFRLVRRLLRFVRDPLCSPTARATALRL